MRPLRLVILGSGNGPHCYASLAASLPDVHVTILSLTQGQRLKSVMIGSKNNFNLVFRNYSSEGKEKVFNSKPDVVTDDPALAIPGSDMIVFMVPANAHEKYFPAISPYVKPGMILVGLPGGAGWYFQAMHFLTKQVRDSCFLLSFPCLPWTCRFEEFGISAYIKGPKDELIGGSAGTSTRTVLGKSPTESLQYTLLDKTKCVVRGHLLAASLSQINAYLHPNILYGRWSDWDGKPVDGVPLFYHEMTRLAVEMMEKISEEVLVIKDKILEQYPEVDMSQLVSIHDMLMRLYNAELVRERSTLCDIFVSSKVHATSQHPMVPAGDEKQVLRYVPDFQHRYFSEDVPFGLVVFKGIAEIMGVKTPTMDRVITWAQRMMGKEYLVDGELKGKDLTEAGHPQRFGISTLARMLGEDE